MKNKLTDLHDHLFAQLERLADEDKKGQDLQEEISRARAMSRIADNLVANSRLALNAAELVAREGKRASDNLPSTLIEHHPTQVNGTHPPANGRAK